MNLEETNAPTSGARKLPLPQELKLSNQNVNQKSSFSSSSSSFPMMTDDVESKSQIKTHVVRDKRPAPVQITAEQILIMANARKEKISEIPKMVIQDEEELRSYQREKREHFEKNVIQFKRNPSSWIKYALWEDRQNESERARSVFERGLEHVYQNPSIWERYAEMEMKRKFVNHARNVLDRGVTLLPRIDSLWFKYAHMEEMLNQPENARKVFERWMKWHPPEESWKLYVQMELRYNEIENCRNILQRMVEVHPKVSAWLYYAKFEQKNGSIDLARQVYENAIKVLCIFPSSSPPGEIISEEQHKINERLLIAFARFEQNCKEFDRARVVYRFALDNIPKGQAKKLFEEYTSFEKQFGSRETITEVISSRCRFQYEQDLSHDPTDYDTWFDYIRLEESQLEKNASSFDRARELYERAISNPPPISEKKLWKRYIYLWIKYALFEELKAKQPDQARNVYKACLEFVPHESFSFSKIWIMFSNFEIRQKSLDSAREILNNALDQAPSDKIYKSYIRTELLLGNIDRVRLLYERYLLYNISNCQTWEQYAKLEAKLGNLERARGIFELAISQPLLDMPEVVWKSFIDFEIGNKMYDHAEQLYERLLLKTTHVKVWVSYALFEKSIERYDTGRSIFNRAEDFFKNTSMEVETNAELEQIRKEYRYQLLKEWLAFESEIPNGKIEEVQARMPKEVIKKRPLVGPSGENLGFEEYVDYEFPDQQKPSAKRKQLGLLLASAQAWKKQKINESGDSIISK